MIPFCAVLRSTEQHMFLGAQASLIVGNSRRPSSGRSAPYCVALPAYFPEHPRCPDVQIGLAPTDISSSMGCRTRQALTGPRRTALLRSIREHAIDREPPSWLGGSRRLCARPGADVQERTVTALVWGMTRLSSRSPRVSRPAGPGPDLWTRRPSSARLRARATPLPPSCSAGWLLVMPATSTPSTNFSTQTRSSMRRPASRPRARMRRRSSGGML
jgi:hypothetical protein